MIERTDRLDGRVVKLGGLGALVVIVDLDHGDVAHLLKGLVHALCQAETCLLYTYISFHSLREIIGK